MQIYAPSPSQLVQSTRQNMQNMTNKSNAEMNIFKNVQSTRVYLPSGVSVICIHFVGINGNITHNIFSEYFG